MERPKTRLRAKKTLENIFDWKGLDVFTSTGTREGVKRMRVRVSECPAIQYDVVRSPASSRGGGDSRERE